MRELDKPLHQSEQAHTIRLAAFERQGALRMLEVPFMGRHVAVVVDENRHRANTAAVWLEKVVTNEEYRDYSLEEKIATAAVLARRNIQISLQDDVYEGTSRKWRAPLDFLSGQPMGIYDRKIILNPQTIAQVTEQQIASNPAYRGMSAEEGLALLQKNLQMVLSHEQEHFDQKHTEISVTEMYLRTRLLATVLLPVAMLEAAAAGILQIAIHTQSSLSDLLYTQLNQDAYQGDVLAILTLLSAGILSVLSTAQYRSSPAERRAVAAEKQHLDPVLISPFTLTFVN